MNSLIASNLTILAALSVGAYPLYYRPTKAQEGFIVIRPGLAYVQMWHQGSVYHLDLFGLATLLSNQNVAVGTEPIKLHGPDDSAVDIPEVGKGLKVENVADKLLMFDPKLREYAVRKVKQEIAQLKRSFTVQTLK